MKQLIYTVSAFFLVIIFLANGEISKAFTTVETPFFAKTILATYGEEIYKRESCSRCHTQKIVAKSAQLISLDGIGIKYSSNWLYHYLLAPQTMIVESKKGSYSNLYAQRLSKSVLKKMRPAKESVIKMDSLWDSMINQADTLLEELNKQNVTIDIRNHTEILALIAYIQQIPSSKEKMSLDSLAHIKEVNKHKQWDRIILDSILLKIVKSEENISMGKQIFDSKCFMCHGKKGEGTSVGSNLTDDYWLYGGKDIDIARAIIHGVPAKGMTAWGDFLSPEEFHVLLAYISSLQGTNPENAKAPQGKRVIISDN